MSTADLSASAAAAKDTLSVAPAPTVAVGSTTTTERPKAGANTVANTANQILFKNELYTSMKQKTMDQEIMARLNKEAKEKEERKFESAKAAVARLETKRKVLIGVGDMIGPPGCDTSAYSSASIAVDLAPHDTVRDVKKKLITAACWTDELPSDFGLYDDVSEEPLKDGQAIELALAPEKVPSAGKAVSRRGAGGGGWAGGAGVGRAPGSIRVPRPYVGVLWAARLV